MDKISEITRRDIVDIIKNGFSVELDEEEYDSSSGEYMRTSDSTYVQAMAMRHYYGSCVKCFIRQ